MKRFKGTAQLWVEELGSAWLMAAGVLLAVSLIFRTWSLLAFFGGILGTLYIHPYDTASRHAPRTINPLADKSKTEKDETAISTFDGKLSERIPLSMRTEIESFSNQIIRDYICWWYQPPSFPVDQLFPDQCQKSLNGCLDKLYFSFSRKDPVLYFDAIFTNSVATLGAVLEDLRIAHKARSDQDPVGLKRFTKTYPNAIVTRMMNDNERADNLRRAASVFLVRFARASDLECKPAAEFLRQLLSRSIFAVSLQSLAHKDTLNQMIVDALGHKRPSSQHAADSKDNLAAALDLATQQAASVSQDIVASSPIIGSPTDEAIAMDEDQDVLAAETFELSQPAARPARGRRLSFKNKSVSSIADFYDDDGNRVSDKRMSFLKRTGSLLSRSRSRSTSPSKSVELNGAVGHNRSRSISPLKKTSIAEIERPATPIPLLPQVTLFRAEIIVNDASDIKPTDFKQTVTIMPKFSILISPLKQEGFTSAGGIGIFRSMRDVQELDAQLRLISNEAVPTLPAYTRLSYAMLENEMLGYLLDVTRSNVLSSSEAFKQFCRPDLMSDEDAEPMRGAQEQLATPERPFFSSLKSSNELVQPMSPTQTSDPRKKPDQSLTSPTDRSNTQELKTLLALQQEQPMSSIMNDSAVEGQESKAHADSYRAHSLPDTTIPIDCSRLDLQNLVSQSMELLTTFYALSSRTWTIRKQLLNVLRNLLLSKNSIYTQAFMDYLETSVLRPFSSANHMATHLRQFNEFMFPAKYVAPVPLSSEASEALAVEARALFVQKGMPSAIRNLMGAPPTAEALGILFDALQDEDFSLGLVSILFTETFKTLMVD